MIFVYSLSGWVVLVFCSNVKILINLWLAHLQQSITSVCADFSQQETDCLLIFHICLLLSSICYIHVFVWVLHFFLLYTEDVCFHSFLKLVLYYKWQFLCLGLQDMVGVVTSLSSDEAWDCCSLSLKSESGRLVAVPINCNDIYFSPWRGCYRAI